MNRVLHSVLRTSRMYETKRRSLLGNESRRLENEVKKQLVNFPPWVFSMTITTSEVIRLKEFCTHISIIVERL